MDASLAERECSLDSLGRAKVSALLDVIDERHVEPIRFACRGRLPFARCNPGGAEQTDCFEDPGPQH